MVHFRGYVSFREGNPNVTSETLSQDLWNPMGFGCISVTSDGNIVCPNVMVNDGMFEDVKIFT